MRLQKFDWAFLANHTNWKQIVFMVSMLFTSCNFLIKLAHRMHSIDLTSFQWFNDSV